MTRIMAQRKPLPAGTHILQAWRITPPDERSYGPYLLREWTWKYVGEDTWQGGQWKRTLPAVEQKSHLPSWWHLGLDIVIYEGLSTCGAQSFLTVSVLSLSLSLIIPADFVCVWWCLFVLWDFYFVFGVSDDWEGMTSNSMFSFLCICCFGMWLLIINI